VKVDLGLIVSDPREAAARARELEDLGVDGTFSFEGPRGPFLPLALAAAATERIELSTAIAVAFARNPMVVAQEAQDLQLLAEGRFSLGLGSQIRAHITRRFSMPWSHPAPRMREFVLAIRAIWHTWATGDPLDFTGEFYSHTLMTPFFNPGPNPFGDPRILLAGVGAGMVEVAGEVADGFIVHPFHSRDFLLADTLPALDRGLARSVRGRADVEVVCQTMVALGSDDAQVADARNAARAQLAFYGSTPAYRGVLDHHGLGELQPRLRDLTRAGRWGDLVREVPDELVDLLTVSGGADDVADQLLARNGDIGQRTALVLYDRSDGAAVPALVQRLQDG